MIGFFVVKRESNNGAEARERAVGFIGFRRHARSFEVSDTTMTMLVSVSVMRPYLIVLLQLLLSSEQNDLEPNRDPRTSLSWRYSVIRKQVIGGLLLDSTISSYAVGDILE